MTLGRARGGIEDGSDSSEEGGDGSEVGGDGSEVGGDGSEVGDDASEQGPDLCAARVTLSRMAVTLSRRAVTLAVTLAVTASAAAFAAPLSLTSQTSTAAEPGASAAAAQPRLATAAPGARAAAEPRASAIGVSQAGSPLVLYTLGSGPRRVLLIGGQHGGPEANTVELVNGLLDYFMTNPDDLPPGVELNVLLVANPDGLADGSRQFLSGVDPNRNWGGRDWRADAYDSNATFRFGLGGPEPFSEPETRALADWVLANRPSFIVNYHSAGGFMFGGRDGVAGELSTAYAGASGYSWPQPGTPGGPRSPLPYAASGSMNVWLRDVGIPALLVELSTPRSTDIERNLAGLEAALQVLADAE